MAETKATAAALRKGIKLRIGIPNVVKIIPPPVPRIRLIGMHFDLMKAFLLPSAIPGIKAVKQAYADHPSSNLLVVGHTDTSGEDAYNLTLSLERADAVAAYLKDDVPAWDKFFSNPDDGKRWGTREIQHMMTVLPDGKDPFYAGPPTGFQDAKTVPAIKRFQASKGMSQSGTADAATRQALIKDYMAIDGTSLPAGITLKAHGCGENFPADAVPDGVRSPDDRRVEMFFFDGPITPAPAADRLSRKGAKDYPEWLSLVTATTDFLPLDPAIGPVIAARLPTQFSLGSTFPKPSAIATLKAVKDRLSQDATLKLLLVGHADLKGEPSTNDPLSLNRAKSAQAWLEGDKDYFRKRFDAKDPVKKWGFAEIQWMLLAIETVGSPCYVGQIDGYPGPATHRALEYFQLLNDLPLTGLADEATLAALIQAYLDLLGPPLAPGLIEVAGGGEDHPPLPFGTATDLGPAFPDNSPLRERRVEAFLFQGAVNPPAASLKKGSETYRTWCRQATEDLTDVTGLQTFLSVVDSNRDPLPGLALQIFQHADDAAPAQVAAAATDDAGQAKIALPEGFYSIQARLGGATLKGGLNINTDGIGAQIVSLVTVAED
jgi:outer membrane protein OmpA-like peptidoglycan-associated protein